MLASVAQRGRLGDGGLGLSENEVELFVTRATGSYSLLSDKQMRVLERRDSNVGMV